MTVYHWLGKDADFDPDIINALNPPEPIVVVDSTEEE